MGCTKLHILDEQCKRTELKVSYINNRLTLNNSAENTYSYLLFGEPFLEERNNKWNAPYLFNAKELDEETGLYYYGARYYDPRSSIWLSTDPLQEKYPNKTPYHYCSNNPVNRIDPLGLTDYIVSKTGYIREKTTLGDKIGNFFKGIFGKKENEENRLFSVGGKMIKVHKRAFVNIKEGEVTVKNKNIKIHYFNVNDDSHAKELFEFLAENTDVEWSRTRIGKMAQGRYTTRNILATSHEESSESSSPEFVTKSMELVQLQDQSLVDIVYMGLMMS